MSYGESGEERPGLSNGTQASDFCSSYIDRVRVKMHGWGQRLMEQTVFSETAIPNRSCLHCMQSLRNKMCSCGLTGEMSNTNERACNQPACHAPTAEAPSRVHTPTRPSSPQNERRRHRRRRHRNRPPRLRTPILPSGSESQISTPGMMISSPPPPESTPPTPSGVTLFEEQYGFKVLSEGVDPTVDLIAVHGLGGHREDTWKTGNGVFWLRDFLPREIPNARILTYGYDGTPDSHQTLHDHAVELVTGLVRERERTSTTERPIIFLAYSIGGIILKDALIHSHSTNTQHLESHHAVITSTCGVLFVGTPHQGTNDLKWSHIARNTGSFFTRLNDTHPILSHLTEHSKDLLRQIHQYTYISKKFDAIFFYETRAPPGAKIVVPKASATVPGSTDTEAIALYSDHENLVKYKSEHDDSFKKVSGHISLIAENAPEKASRNWEQWRRTKAAGAGRMPVTFEIPFDLCYRRNPHFTGRRAILDTLISMIKCTRSQPVPIVLHGIGGIGKTQIVLEYIYASIREYKSIFWINATTKETTQDGFREAAQRLVKAHARVSHFAEPNYRRIAQHLDMVGAIDPITGHVSAEKEHIECVVQGVRGWLNNHENRQWLLVFDHADYMGGPEIQQFLPSASHGTIIMTSSRPGLGAPGETLQVQEMPHLEAEDLLLKSAGKGGTTNVGPDDRIASDDIACLGGIPIAIVQAGAYVGARSIKFPDYRKILNTSLDRVMREKPSNLVWQYGEKTVFATWDVAFQDVKRANREAAELLSFCSFISNTIEEETLCRVKKLSKHGLGDYMKELFSFSLIQRTSAEDVFYINPLVHTWGRERLERQECLRRTQEAAILVGQDVYSTYQRTESWDVGKSMIWHVYATNANVKEYVKEGIADAKLVGCLDCLVRVNKVWGWWQTAAMLQRLVVEGTRRVRGKVDEKVLTAKANLASLYVNQGQLKEAEKLQFEVVQESTRFLGESHQFTLKAIGALESTREKQGS